MFNWVCLYGLEIHVSRGVAIVGLLFLVGYGNASGKLKRFGNF